MGSAYFCMAAFHAGLSATSRMNTERRLALGISMPITFLPGIGERMRRLMAWSAICRLFE